MMLATTNKQTSWQAALTEAVTDPKELLALLELGEDLLLAAIEAGAKFNLRVPRSYVQRMQKANPADPLFLQVWPLAAELNEVPGFISDPLQEKNVNPVRGLLHKFHGRALLVAAGGCAVNCRYCFRREFPYPDNNPGSKGWVQALAYIRNDESLSEIILSGGDPLLLKDTQFQVLIQQLADIPHLRRLRIHTRFPVVIPERITTELITCLTATRLQPVVVLHINHAQEIDAQVKLMIMKLRHANITVLNQSVLLKGVNDSVAALVALSEELFAAGVLPYYLHLLDKVRGAAHFLVADNLALQLWRDVNKKLPGYLVPKLVREEPGAGAKVVIS